jgi:hypothetical protein
MKMEPAAMFLQNVSNHPQKYLKTIILISESGIPTVTVPTYS